MNEKIKEIAEFDGWVKRDITFTHGRELYENDHHTQWLDSMPYLTDLNSLHRVALDVMDRLKSYSDNPLWMDRSERHKCHIIRTNALISIFKRPNANGEYTDLVDAVYDAIVYLKKQELCQPK